MSKNVYRFGQQLIESGASWIFAPISWAWGLVVFCKNRLFQHQILEPFRVAKPVVSIGNITAGGTGKTPLIHLLAETLSHHKVAILSRGYGKVPDEPLLLAERLPKAKIYIGKDRIKLAQKAIDEGAELLLLDDGFQHRRLHRDFEWVVLDDKDPLGKKRYLPWGYLRDSPQRLKEAHALFIQGEHPDFPNAISFKLRVRRIVNRAGATKEVERGDPVGLFCGIGAPRRFRQTVADLGARAVDEWILADHEAPKARRLEAFVNRCKSLGAKYILTTEKDAIKLPAGLRLSLPLYYLEMVVEIVEGKKQWNAWVEKIDRSVHNIQNE